MQMINASQRHPGPLFAAAILGLAAVGLAIYFKPFPAAEDKSLLVSDSLVKVQPFDSGFAFIPLASEGHPSKNTGIILYGAARVPPASYAYLARSCARSGYTAVVPSFPLNMANLDSGIALKIAKAFPQVRCWVLAGHSLGGSAAASFIAANAKAREPAAVSVGGLILLASYPKNGSDLSTLKLSVVTVGATHDALSTPARIAEARIRLPADSRYVEISGGNHAQFGEYGPQPGDGIADIPGPTQRNAIVEEVLNLLDGVEAGVGK